MSNSTSSIDALRDSLIWLASSPEEQIAEMLLYGGGVGDLVSAFDEAVGGLAWRSLPILPAETGELLEELDQQLGVLVDDPDAWTMTALCERVEWQRVRRTAARAIAALSATRPTLEQPIALAH